MRFQQHVLAQCLQTGSPTVVERLEISGLNLFVMKVELLNQLASQFRTVPIAISFREHSKRGRSAFKIPWKVVGAKINVQADSDDDPLTTLDQHTSDLPSFHPYIVRPLDPSRLAGGGLDHLGRRNRSQGCQPEGIDQRTFWKEQVR